MQSSILPRDSAAIDLTIYRVSFRGEREDRRLSDHRSFQEPRQPFRINVSESLKASIILYIIVIIPPVSSRSDAAYARIFSSFY